LNNQEQRRKIFFGCGFFFPNLKYFFREETSYQLLEKSVVIGLTENLGEPRTVKAKDGSIIKWPRSMPMYNL
jgi:hypothetical protein